MNIFHTDSCPIISAHNLDDIRVNKMIIESAALLANAIAFHGGLDSDLPIAKTSGKPFKTKAWQNHPSCIWTKSNRSNYMWLVEHMESLISQMQYRKDTIHSMNKNIQIIRDGAKLIPPGAITPFANCTPYKSIEDTIKAYKLTMAYKWEHDAKEPQWSKVSKPDWYDCSLIIEAQNAECEFEWTGERLSRSKREKGWLTNDI